MGSQAVTHSGLCTLFCEIELCVNSRPLSAVTSDIGSIEVVTPIQLLTLRGSPEGLIDSDETQCYSKRRWRQVQCLSEQFWRKWCRHYRVTLCQRRKWAQMKRNVAVGDVVMVVDTNEARCHWPLGRVMKVFPGTDGLVRSVELVVRDKTITRPISKLVMLVEGEDLD